MLTSRLMPTNRIANSTAAQVRVVRALRHSGTLNAGTPSETASTPVSATAPDEKARRIQQQAQRAGSGAGLFGDPLRRWGVGRHDPVATPIRPKAIRPITATMYGRWVP